MAERRAAVLGIMLAGLSFAMPAGDARASSTSLVGNVASYTSPDVWEVQCLRATQGVVTRTVATTNSPDKFVAIATVLSPRPVYGRAAASEVFSPGGVGSEVFLDRVKKGRMKLLVTVKQTGGNAGGTYFVNLSCVGSTVAPKIVLLRDG